MLHNGVPCCGTEWNVVETDTTGFPWVACIRMVPTLSQWSSVELVGIGEWSRILWNGEEWHVK